MKILLYIVIILAIIFLYKKYQWCKANPTGVIQGETHQVAVTRTCDFFSLGNSTDFVIYGLFNNPYPVSVAQ